MELSNSNHNTRRFTFNLFTILLWIFGISIFIVILSYPYKNLIKGNVLVDLEVNLQNKNFNSIVKTNVSSYFVLSEPKGTLSFTPQNIWVYLIAQSKIFFISIAGFFVILNARKLKEKITEERAFDNDNSKLVMMIAGIVIISPFVFALRTYLLNQYLPSDLFINGFKVMKPNPLDFQPIIRGFIWGSFFIAFAKVLKQGRKIKEENELTV